MSNSDEKRKRTIWERLRRLIDGADSDQIEEINGSARELRQSEIFLKGIARELEATLLRESFAAPDLPVCVPREFIVFLSPADDKDWLGNKRRTLVQALNHALARKVHELDGKKKATGASPVISLRMDATLEEGEIRVKACWEPTSSGTTLVVLPGETEKDKNTPTIDPDITHVYLGDTSPDGDPTQVVLPDAPLFHVEVWRENNREGIVPVTQPLTRIGRGARSIPVDLRLKDPNISRLHATIEVDKAGNYWLNSQGQNPTIVNGREVSRNERVQVMPEARIEICSYSLCIKQERQIRSFA